MTAPMIEARCNDACGALETYPADQSPPGWSWLSIAGAWRCPACYQALEAAKGYAATPGEPFVDTVPPASRGALPKATADTISPVSVRG